jgi:hypothetical protein
MLCDDLVAGGAPASGCDTADWVRHGSPPAKDGGPPPRKRTRGAARLRGPRAIAAPRLPVAFSEKNHGLSALLRSRSDWSPRPC